MTITTVSSPSRLDQTVVLSPNSPHAKTIHRIALAPLTRYRNTPGTQAPNDLVKEYYTQRASKHGLMITEATFISEEAGGYPLAPGIYSEEQVKEWKKITDSVHAKGAYIFCQFWALGRANAGDQKHIETVAPSAIGLKDHPVPRELTEEDIDRYIESYRTASENALRAGFDGVEVHGANGYLIDQFLQKVSNHRTDSYGTDRLKFMRRALDACVSVLGQERVAIRFSPWGRFQSMLDSDPYETFLPVIKELRNLYPRLGYVHFVEPRNWTGTKEFEEIRPAEGIVESNDPFRAILRGIDISSFSSPSAYAKTNPITPDPSEEYPTVILSAAGHDPTNVREEIERTGDVAALGRWFIANPDLPYRIFNNLPANHYDRNTFYSSGAKGYTDLPTYEEEVAAGKKQPASL